MACQTVSLIVEHDSDCHSDYGAGLLDTCQGRLLPIRFESFEDGDDFVAWLVDSRGYGPTRLSEHELQQAVDEWSAVRKAVSR